MSARPFLVCTLLVAACGGGSKQSQPTTTTTSPATAGEEATPAAGTPAPSAQKSLYERLGGLPAITAVVNEFVARTTSDPRIKQRFFNTDAENLKKLLVQFVCVAAGGPCKYEGRSMEDAHAGMDLVDDEFTALVQDLVAAMDKFKVPEKEKNEVLGALGPLKPTMVVPADKLHPIDEAKLAQVTKLAKASKDPEVAELLNDA